MPYAPQGVKGLDDDDDDNDDDDGDDDDDVEYLMEHFLIISSDNAVVQGKSFYFNILSSLGSY
jgi:hypothetical protein